MENHEEVMKLKFQTLKTNISSCYKGVRYKWLRCCLYDIVPGAELNKMKVGAHLFNALSLKGDISYSNVQLLEEITEITDVDEAKEYVKEYKESNEYKKAKELRKSEADDVGESGSKITPYRRGLVKTLRTADVSVLDNVHANYYDLSGETFSDLWDLVFKLERELLLEDDEFKIKRFTNLIEGKSRKTFEGEALNPDRIITERTLQEQINDLPEPPTDSPGGSPGGSTGNTPPDTPDGSKKPVLKKRNLAEGLVADSQDSFKTGENRNVSQDYTPNQLPRHPGRNWTCVVLTCSILLALAIWLLQAEIF